MSTCTSRKVNRTNICKKLTFDLLNRCLNLKGIYQNLVTFVTSRRVRHFARLNAKTIPENAPHVTTIKTGH